MTNTAAAPPPISPPVTSDGFEAGTTPVFGAPLGTTATWLGTALGAVLASRDGDAEAVGTFVADGTGDGTEVALARGVGVADAPSANAGTVLARTAVHPSAMALRTVRRMNRSLSSAGPPSDAADRVTDRAQRRGSEEAGCKEQAKPSGAV
jgi:hypothetical protein